MQWCMYHKGSLSVVCILILANCAKHKLTPVLGTPLPALPTVGRPENNVNQGEGGVPGTIRLLLAEPQKMSLSAKPHAPKEDVSRIDRISVLVNLRDGVLHPDSAVTIQNALQASASQLLFLCPDRMHSGSAEHCRLTSRGSLNDLFRDQLLEQGVSALQAAAVPIQVHADLTSPSRNAFDIHAAAVNSPSSGEHLWRVVPRNPGNHKLELKVTLSARIPKAGDLQGVPVVLVHSVSVIGGENFLNHYWPVTTAGLAAVALFAAWALWPSVRPSAFSNR